MAEAARGLAVRTADDLLDDLAQRRFVVVSGKGGVGRTTIAALCGVALAERGRKVLVATTGHDDRLAWMLGAAHLSDAPQSVQSRLWIQRLSPGTCIREYGALVLRSSRLSSAVFDNRVVSPLLRAIPGLDDFSLVGKAWHEAFRGGAYDTVIFDGPATGHLLYTLGVPHAILQTIAPGPLTREAELMRAHFCDPAQTQAVLVGLPEMWPLTELGDLGAALRQQLGIAVAAVVVNGLWPADVPPLPQNPDNPRLAELFSSLDGIGAIGRRQRGEVAQWRAGDAAASCGSRRLVLVPWRFGGVCDATALRGLLEFPRGQLLDHGGAA